MTPFFVRPVFAGAVAVFLCSGAAAAADLSAVPQWDGQYPSDESVNGKPLWDLPGVLEAVRAAMGKYFFSPLKKDRNAPEAPVATDGKGFFAAWTCTNGDDCGGNNLTVYFDISAGKVQVCLRSSEGSGGKVQDLWLADGEARALPLNGCGIGERHPFASLKKFGAK
jgi:hypothetical protein